VGKSSINKASKVRSRNWKDRCSNCQI